MRGLLFDLLDLLVPRSCAGCGAESVTVCGRCLEGFAAPVRATIPRYGTAAVFGSGEYTGTLRSCLLAFKERDRRDLAPLLGLLLARAVSAAVEHTPGAGAPLVLVPVPAASKAVRRRGFDHIAVIGGEAVRVLRRAGLEARLCPLLEVAAHRDQVGFGSSGRRLNVRGTHRVRTGWAPALEAAAGRGRCGADGAGMTSAVLLDDISTTGATAAESARALRRVRIATRAVAVVGIAPGGPRFAPGDGI